MADAIRRIDPDDAPAWAGLRREALETEPLVFGASVPDDSTLLVEFALARLTQEDSAIFGAFAGHRLDGIVGVRREPGAKERHKAFLWGMYVTPSARRRGLGTALLRAAVEHARSWHGAAQIQLSVSDRAREARALYERLGFQAWGREPRALGVDGQFADETHMALDLRPAGRLGLMSHLHLVALVVRDYDPAIAFFVDVLQFELVEDVPSLTNDGRPKRWVVVRPVGGQTGILLARADGAPQAEAVGRQFAGRVGFFLRVGDFEASYGRMVAAGVTFVSPPRVESYGRVAVFLDLEGNRWDLLG